MREIWPTAARYLHLPCKYAANARPLAQVHAGRLAPPGMDDLRGKKPETIRRKIWIHWLAYNLIRKVTAQAALHHEKLPRELSFAGAGSGQRRVVVRQCGRSIHAVPARQNAAAGITWSL